MLARGLAGSLRVSSRGRISSSSSSRLAMSAPNKRPHPFFIAAGLKVHDDGENDSSKRAKSTAAANDDDSSKPPRPRAPPAPRLPAPNPHATPPQQLPNHPPPLPRAPRDPSAFVALSWNVAGLTTKLEKDPELLSRLVAAEGADALCLQEHKLQAARTKAGKAGKDGALEIFGECCLGVAGGGCGGGSGSGSGSSSRAAAANKLGLPGWHVTWACSTEKLGYSGVAIASRVEPLSVRIGIGNGDVATGDGAAASASSSTHPFDVEGRFVAVEFERFWLATAYVPNSSEGLRRLKYRVGEVAAAKATAESGLPAGTPCWDQALANFIAGLRNTSSPSSSSSSASASSGSAHLPKPVVLMGDLNCARTPLDIYTTKNKLEAAGFTPEERESFERRILGKGRSSSSSSAASSSAAGLRDVWRERHPERREYTYWSQRGRCFPTNNGWRLDYTLVHSELAGGDHHRVGPQALDGRGGGEESDDDGGDGGGRDGGDGGEEEAKGENANNKKSLIHDVFHLPHVRGSDHCPVGVAICAEGHGEELA